MQQVFLANKQVSYCSNVFCFHTAKLFAFKVKNQLHFIFTTFGQSLVTENLIKHLREEETRGIFLQ
jgi:hypothetical protein